MPNPINESSTREPTVVSPETPTEVSNPKLPDEKPENENELAGCDLRFRDQCKIVWDGLRKGVKYDGCTAVPDFNFGSDCCGEHDAHYQLTDVSKWEADKRLRECITKKGYPFIAWCYWLGLTIGGYPFYRRKQNEARVNLDAGGPT